MDKVIWKFENLYPADAQKCYEEIGENNVTPQDVLNIAKDPNTELHKCFCWDNTEAANRFRLSQAQDILRSFVLEKPKEDPNIGVKLRAFSITTEKNTYAPTRVFVQKKDEYAALLSRAKNELIAFKQKYRILTELEEIFKAIDGL